MNLAYKLSNLNFVAIRKDFFHAEECSKFKRLGLVKLRVDDS